ncbi:hypothetical protein CB1_001119005 [Camelus ferus]|nr:hypothetical protein CB1_001119005 [Camelus ferus]
MEVSPLQVQLAEGTRRGASARPGISLAARERGEGPGLWENNLISIWNNGKGIPVVEHKVEKMYVPALIFGQLLTSSNYDDEEKKVTGGRNGYGAKLCNIFSTKFTVETASREYKKMFKQASKWTWMNNMGKADKDIVALMVRRAYDIAGSTKDVKVFLNGSKLPICFCKEASIPHFFS